MGEAMKPLKRGGHAKASTLWRRSVGAEVGGKTVKWILSADGLEMTCPFGKIIYMGKGKLEALSQLSEEECRLCKERACCERSIRSFLTTH